MSDQNPPAADTLTTDVIVVVKGAGSQQLDSTLNNYLDGFLRAVRYYDPHARVRIGPETRILAGYEYSKSFHGKEQDLVEILIHERPEADPNSGANDDSEDAEGSSSEQSGPGPLRRIWVKEAYWEDSLAPPGTIRSLISEWRLTSYALVKLMEQFIFPWQDGRRYDDEGEETRNLNAAKHGFWAYLAYFSLAHLVILGFLSLVGLWGLGPAAGPLHIVRSSSGLLPVLGSPLLRLALLLALALLTALGPAYQAWSYRRKQASGENLPRMPGLGYWVLFALALGLVLEPAAYIFNLLGYFLLVVATLLVARRLWWRGRPDWYSDAPRPRYINEAARFIDWQANRLAKGTQLLYRAFVVLGVPVAVAFLVLIKLVHILDLFGDTGKKIDTRLSEIVNRALGDVTAYALDPAQAARVQQTVAADIHTFAHLKPKGAGADAKKTVGQIHVFAHSQGTPITYEVLFHMLDDDDFQRVRNYFTIGSVLNLHNQVNEMLDDVFRHRFPPEDYRRGNRGFKWFNFWNFTDPITQFTGLEPYRKDRLRVKKDGDLLRYSDGTPRIDFAKASPFSIKTRESFLKNHSEYWSNVEEIHLPMIKHIFSKSSARWLPEEWAAPRILYRINANAWNQNLVDPADFKRGFRRHRVGVLATWLGLIAALVAGGALIWPQLTSWIEAAVLGTRLTVGGVVNFLITLLPADSTEALLTFWEGSVKTAYLNRTLVDGVGLALLAWAVLGSLAMLVPQRGPEQKKPFEPTEERVTDQGD